MRRTSFREFLLFAFAASAFAKQGGNDFQLLTWNVLTQLFEQYSVSELIDGTIDPALIDEDVRSVMQIHNIRKYDPDLMCLQEMDEYRYNIFVKEFGHEYSSLFAPHGSEHWKEFVNENQNNVLNGNALFYRKDKFVKKHSEDFQLSDNQNTALFTVLKPRGAGPSGALISAACIHIQNGVEPEYVQLRAFQLAAVLEKLAQIRSSYSVGMEIISGDFNENPLFPGSANVVANGYKNAFEATGVQQPDTFYGNEVFFNRTNFPLDFIYFKTYESTNVTVDEAKTADVNDKNLDFELHITTIETVFEQIMDLKTEKIRNTTPSYLSYLKQFFIAFEKVRPKTTPLPDWKDDLRTRAFRLGSDHLLVQAGFTIKNTKGKGTKLNPGHRWPKTKYDRNSHWEEKDEDDSEYELY